MGKRELILLIIISLIAVLVSMFQFFLFWEQTASGYSFSFIHNYPQDYYYYLSFIRQGMEGKFLLTSLFTPETFQPKFILTFYPLIGFAGNIFHISVNMIYLTARIFFAVLLLISGYYLSALIFTEKKYRILTLIFILAGTPFWVFDHGTVRMYGGFWTGFDPFLRVAFLPHHLFANCALITSIILLCHGISKRNILWTIAGGIIGAAGEWTNTAILFPIITAGFCIFIFDLKNFRRNTFHLSVFLIINAIPAIYLQRNINTDFPWGFFNEFEKRNSYPLGINFTSVLQILGITGVFACLSVPFIIFKGNNIQRALLGWFISPFLGLMFLQKYLQLYLPVSNIRYLQSAFYIPSAILGAYFIRKILQYKLKRGRMPFRILIVIVTSVVFAAAVLPSFYASYLDEMSSVVSNKFNSLIYIPSSFMDVTRWLSDNGKSGEVVLSDTVSSPLIPPFSGKKVVYGHPFFTYKPEEKVQDVANFYSFKTANQSYEILTRNKVSYVIDWLKNPILKQEFILQVNAKKAYENRDYIIYKIGN